MYYEISKNHDTDDCGGGFADCGGRRGVRKLPGLQGLYPPRRPWTNCAPASTGARTKSALRFQQAIPSPGIGISSLPAGQRRTALA